MYLFFFASKMSRDPLSAATEEAAGGHRAPAAAAVPDLNMESGSRGGGLRGAGHTAARVGGGEPSERAPTVTLHIVGPDGSKSPLKIKLSDDVSTLRALVTQMHDTADWTTQTDRREDRHDFSGVPDATLQLSTGSVFPTQAFGRFDPDLARQFGS